MNDIDRVIFVFYQKNGELFQVALNDEETSLIEDVLIGLHNGKIKIMRDKFCDIHKP